MPFFENRFSRQVRRGSTLGAGQSAYRAVVFKVGDEHCKCLLFPGGDVIKQGLDEPRGDKLQQAQ